MVGEGRMALTLKPPKPVTDEELLEFSRRNPGLQFERSAGGELIVTPTGSASGRRELALGAQLARWAEERGGGVAFGSSAGFRMADGAILSPDASWMRRDRWDALTEADREGFAPLCPDAVFEIASQSDALGTLREKMDAYLGYGAKLAVLIDPYNRTVEVFQAGETIRTLTTPTTLSLDPVMPGLILETIALFEI